MNEYIPALNPVECQSCTQSMIKRFLSENAGLKLAETLFHTARAILRDFYTHNWRQYRPQRIGGFFSPVECSIGGFSSSVRGLQDGEYRNKRVVNQLSDRSTRQSCLNSKTQLGTTIMNAIALSAPAFLSRKQTPAPAGLPQAGTLVFTQTPTGITLSKDGVLVAWVVVGCHQGQVDNHPHRIEFVDVAYHRQTQRGINLETADFDTLPEALGFLCDVFGLKAEGGAV